MPLKDGNLMDVNLGRFLIRPYFSCNLHSKCRYILIEWDVHNDAFIQIYSVVTILK